jgi:hypothetical protein
MENTDTPAEQPIQDSPEDRAARIFSDEQPEAPQRAEAPQQETAEETFELEYEGDKFVLPKKLEKAVLQEKDYTQKSQSLAEMRKDVEHRFAQIKLAQSEAQFEQSVAPERQQLQMIDAVLGEYGKLEWAKMSTDELVRKKLEMDQYREMRTAADAAIKAKRGQFDQTYKQELDRLKGEANETLKKRVNWTDATDTEVRSYVRELGITDAEYDSVFDPRHKQILFEASQYRKLKAGAQPATQQVKAVKTGASNPMPSDVKDKLNFRKALSKAPPGSPDRKRLVEDRAANIFGR